MPPLPRRVDGHQRIFKLARENPLKAMQKKLAPMQASVRRIRASPKNPNSTLSRQWSQQPKRVRCKSSP